MARACRPAQNTLMKPKPLLVVGVLKELKALAQMSGSKVQDRKKDKIKLMLVAAQVASSKH